MDHPISKFQGGTYGKRQGIQNVIMKSLSVYKMIHIQFQNVKLLFIQQERKVPSYLTLLRAI